MKPDDLWFNWVCQLYDTIEGYEMYWCMRTTMSFYFPEENWARSSGGWGIMRHLGSIGGNYEENY